MTKKQVLRAIERTYQLAIHEAAAGSVGGGELPEHHKQLLTRASSVAAKMFADYCQAKPKEQPATAYTLCVDYWLKQFHPGWTFGGMQGKALKSIVKKITGFLEGTMEGVDGVSDKAVLVHFQKFCQGLPTFYCTKDLNVLDSHFNTIISEILKGPQKGGFNSQNSGSRVFGKYAGL